MIKINKAEGILKKLEKKEIKQSLEERAEGIKQMSELKQESDYKQNMSFIHSADCYVNLSRYLSKLSSDIKPCRNS